MELKTQIQQHLQAFSQDNLRDNALALLNILGYVSEKTLVIDNTPDTFLAEFDKRDRKFRKDKSLFERWKSVEFLFQITDDEIQSAGGQTGLDFQSGFEARNYQSYLFFALDLEKKHYTRTQLAYRLLKQNTYYDKIDLFLRSNVTAYEASDSFQKRQAIIALVQKIPESFLHESQNSLSGTIMY